jgi:alpha-glucoside transport system ATP-binding protein
MTDLVLHNVKKSFGKTDILHGIDLTVKQGEFVVFVGPSGCGKSTLLRLIAGLEELSGGQIRLGEEDIGERASADRGIAMVFQSYALYPHMTVSDNMAFGLKMAKIDKATIQSRVKKAADMLQLTPLLERLPKELSGGQRQRVAIGRAITRDPKIFLFDEPLSNLDAALRVATRIEIASLKEALPETTMIYVTHDQVEAMTLADRIVVLNAGRIEQVGTPLELYTAPQNEFVAKFIGSPAMNVIDAASAQGLATKAIAGAARIGFRPEHLVQTTNTPDIEGHAAILEHLGEMTIVHVDIGGGQMIIAKLAGLNPIKKNDPIGFSVEAGHVHSFDAAGKALGA